MCVFNSCHHTTSQIQNLGEGENILNKRERERASMKKSSAGKCKEDQGKRRRMAPQGWFTVCVGPKKQRFVIKTECANHPLFKKLLEEAESEYGFNSTGPLSLPCNVDEFYKVLIKMEADDQANDDGSGFGRPYASSYQYLSPFHKFAINQF